VTWLLCTRGTSCAAFPALQGTAPPRHCQLPRPLSPPLPLLCQPSPSPAAAVCSCAEAGSPPPSSFPPLLCLGQTPGRCPSAPPPPAWPSPAAAPPPPACQLALSISPSLATKEAQHSCPDMPVPTMIGCLPRRLAPLPGSIHGSPLGWCCLLGCAPPQGMLWCRGRPGLRAAAPPGHRPGARSLQLPEHHLHLPPGKEGREHEHNQKGTYECSSVSPMSSFPLSCPICGEGFHSEE